MLNGLISPELYYERKLPFVSLRSDYDVLAELKSMGKGYQTRINYILHKAMFGYKSFTVTN